MSLKDTVNQLLAKELARLYPQTDLSNCAVCREIAAIKRTGHRDWIKRNDDDENPSPIFEKLYTVVHFGDGCTYEIRLCPHCGKFYYYCFKGKTYQISYSSNDYDEFNPAEEWCIPGSASEVIARVLDNYDIKISRFKRIVRLEKFWLVTTSTKKVGDDDIVI